MTREKGKREHSKSCRLIYHNHNSPLPDLSVTASEFSALVCPSLLAVYRLFYPLQSLVQLIPRSDAKCDWNFREFYANQIQHELALGVRFKCSDSRQFFGQKWMNFDSTAKPSLLIVKHHAIQPGRLISKPENYIFRRIS